MAEEYDQHMPVVAPICPTCGQPASRLLAGPEHDWECRNEACPEFGQAIEAYQPPAEIAEPASPPEPA